MSVECTTAVWKDPACRRLTDSKRILLLRLADYANDAGRAWPSVPRLAADLNRSERNVRKALAQLRDAGEIVQVDTVGKGVPVYEVQAAIRLRDKLAIAYETDAPASDAATPVATDRGREHAPLSEAPGHPVASDTPPLSEAPPLTTIELSENRQCAGARSDFHDSVVELHAELCMVLGIDPPTNGHGLGDLAPIGEWLAKEPDQAEAIETIIRRRVRQKQSTDPGFLPSTWRYFDAAVSEGLQARARKQEVEAFDPQMDGERARWRSRLKIFREKGSWHSNIWGAPPGEPGCCVPIDLLRDFAAGPS